MSPENAHLYIADRNCHAVFLAVCHDNGFARLLERYQDNPIAQAKILLVDAGVVAREIAELRGFNYVSLDGVFEEMHGPNQARSKRKRGLPLPQTALPPAQKTPIIPSTTTNVVPAKLCQRGRKCTNKTCRFTHPPPKKAAKPPTAPRQSTLPVDASACGNEQISKNPARQQLNAIVKNTKRSGKTDSVSRARGNPIEKAKRSEKISYLEYAGLNHVLPAPVRDHSYLMRFPFRTAAALGKDLCAARIVEVEVD